MKILAKLALAALLVLGLSCSGVNKQVKVNIRQQETKGTCWMASMRMAIETYKGVEVKECELMNALNDRYGYPMGALDCCSPWTPTIMVTQQQAMLAMIAGIWPNVPPPPQGVQQSCTQSCPATKPTAEPEDEAGSDDAATEAAQPGPSPKVQAPEVLIEIPNIPYLRSCARGGDTQDIFVMLDVVAKFRYRMFNRAMEWSELKASIDNGFMILSVISQPLAGFGHMQIINGYVEDGGKRYVVIAETTLGMEQWVEYETYLGSGQSVWEMAIVITEEPAKTKQCNWVFGNYVCLKSVSTPTLLERIGNFFRSLLK